MTVVLVGLNHETAPVELREQFYLSDYGLRLAMEALTRSDHPGVLQECAIVSTCNRLEIYGEAENAGASQAAIVEFLTCLHNTPETELQPQLYLKEGREAVEHLFHVAAGLDSLILGEPQILGQVADAMTHAQTASTCGSILSHLFAQAVHAGKRARAETDISRYTMSISHAAVYLVKQQLGDLKHVRALVIGAGEMAEHAARALQMHGAGQIEIISRTYSHAAMVAERYGLRPLNWDDLGVALTHADVVVSATGAPHTVIHEPEVALAHGTRGERPLLLVDVAVPRDIDESVGELAGITLFDIDDLQMVIDQHRAQRQAAVAKVELILADETESFTQWLSSRQVVPVIVDLRRKAEALADAEVEQALRRLQGLNEREQAIITQLAHRIVNKLLHAPTSTLKQQAASGHGSGYAQAVRELFALGEDEDEQWERTANG